MLYYFALVFALYFLLMILLIIGWKNIYAPQGSVSKYHFISIIVAARNEEENILSLVTSLSEVNYPKEYFEVIVVDDHSTDLTYDKVNSFPQNQPKINAFKLVNGEGKKDALTFGIQEARGEIIVTTDADCIVHPDWLGAINQAYADQACQFLVGAVKINPTNFFSSLQSIEFATVIGTGAATIGWRFPSMCNGANLSFRKKVFEEVNGYKGNQQFASGDDQFLMQKFHEKFPGSVFFLKNPLSVVSTKPSQGIPEFFCQRMRWAGKWSALSFFSKGLAFFVFLFQASWMIALFYSLIHPDALLFSLIMVKFVMELFFVQVVLQFLSIPFSIFSFLVLQFIYAPYVVSVALLSQIKIAAWKGRVHRQR